LQGGGEALTFCDIRFKAPNDSPMQTTLEPSKNVIEASQYVISAVHPQEAVRTTDRRRLGSNPPVALLVRLEALRLESQNRQAESMMAP
jgi:hypothetical protein